MSMVQGTRMQIQEGVEVVVNGENCGQLVFSASVHLLILAGSIRMEEGQV